MLFLFPGPMGCRPTSPPRAHPTRSAADLARPKKAYAASSGACASPYATSAAATTAALFAAALHVDDSFSGEDVSCVEACSERVAVATALTRVAAASKAWFTPWPCRERDRGRGVAGESMERNLPSCRRVRSKYYEKLQGGGVGDAANS